jgi:hypothetical protein
MLLLNINLTTFSFYFPMESASPLNVSQYLISVNREMPDFIYKSPPPLLPQILKSLMELKKLAREDMTLC